MNVDELYQWINFMSNKQQSGQISPDEFNKCLGALYLEPLRIKLGLPEEYQVGLPQARQSYQVSQMITDDIKKFITEATIDVNASGFFPIPANYAYFSSLRYVYVEAVDDGCNAAPIVNDNFIEIVTDGEYVFRLNNAVTPPTLAYPIGNFYGSGIRIKPNDITQAILTYVRMPVKPIRNYTILPNDEDVYNPTGSVQLEYPEMMHNDFAVIVAKYFGINLKDVDLINFASQRQNAGQ